MWQILAHLWGDYLLQSDWMAQNKRRSSFAALAHALFYSLPFALLIRDAPAPLYAALFVAGTHFFVDRFGVARYLVWAKNWIGPAPRRETFVEAVKRHKEWGTLGATATKAELDKIDEDRRRLTGNLPWKECSATGYAPSRPDFLTVWLLIIADNTLHLTLNAIALKWL